MEIVLNIDITRRQVGSNDHRIDSMNLRDLLRVEHNDESRTNLAEQGLSSSSNFEKRGGGSRDRVQSSRTLRDIIRKKSWKSFKDMLIRRRLDSGSNLVSSAPITVSDDAPIHRHNSFRNVTRWDSTQITTPESDGSDHPNSESTTPRSRSAMLQNITIERPQIEFEGLGEEPGGEAENNEEVANGGGGGGREEPLARMSLMALLAETDKPICINGSPYVVDKEVVEEEEGRREYNNCCVCMLRHKGSAFIPCGHTFCRLCSRELWVQRGICPLCNNVILEILDIF